MIKTAHAILGFGVLAVGVLGLFAVQAAGSPGPRVQPITSAAAVASPASAVATRATSVDLELQRQVRKMLIDRMGLSAAEADSLARSMVQRIPAVRGSDAGDILNECLGQAGDNAQGSATTSPGSSPDLGSSQWRGMMRGSNGGFDGMMGGAL